MEKQDFADYRDLVLIAPSDVELVFLLQKDAIAKIRSILGFSNSADRNLEGIERQLWGR